MAGRRNPGPGAQKQAEILRKIFDRIPVMISFFDPRGRLELVNPEWERTFGWTIADLTAMQTDILTHAFPESGERRRAAAFVAAATGQWTEFGPRARDGRVIESTWAAVRLSDGSTINIGKDITVEKRAEQQLRDSREQLRALTASLSGAREAESVRISRELHDELGSVLTSLRWELEALQQEVKDVTAPGRLEQRLRGLIGMTDSAISSVRRISGELRPTLLDDLGLIPAIEWQVQQFGERTGIVTRCECDTEMASLPQDQATAVFRILQEALTNVLRHAQASRVDVTIHPDGNRGFLMSVADDGRGITEEQRSGPRSLGLLGMRERAHLLGATLDIRAMDPGGTLLTLHVPDAGSH
jgi:PAS domain S-box-containing protein